MRVLKISRVKDNTLVGKESFSDIPNLVNRVRDKTLECLEQEGVFVFPDAIKSSEDITREQMVLQSVNNKYRTSNVMGFLGYGDERLVIYSRFCGDGCNDGKDYFLHYLMSKVLNLPAVLNLKTDASLDDDILDFLMFFFPYYLKVAMRKGLYKTYICRKYNDANVKGTIDIARHIAKNTPFIGNIVYNQREFSYDNHLTELIRHTIEYIKSKPYGKTILAKVKEEVSIIRNATARFKLHGRQKIIYANKKNIVKHSYFHEYRTLQHLCLLILQHRGHVIGAGARQVYGVLFDGSWLWEEYVNLLIGESFYHPRNKGREGGQRLFDRETEGKKRPNVGLVYPDFISKDNGQRIIADAKYKPIENIARDDYLQVLSYMFRFDASVGYYLYPESEENGDMLLRLNRGTTYEKNVAPRSDVWVVKHGLKIPTNTESYESFCSIMQANEKMFKGAVRL